MTIRSAFTAVLAAATTAILPSASPAQSVSAVQTTLERTRDRAGPKKGKSAPRAKDASKSRNDTPTDRVCLTLAVATADTKLASALPVANPGAELNYEVVVNPDYTPPIAPGIEDSLRTLLQTHVTLAGKKCLSDPRATHVVVLFHRTIVHAKAFMVSGPSAGSPTLMVNQIVPAVKVDVMTSSSPKPIASRIFTMEAVGAHSATILADATHYLLSFSGPTARTEYYDIRWHDVLEAEKSVVPQLADGIVELLGDASERRHSNDNTAKADTEAPRNRPTERPGSTFGLDPVW